MKKDKQKSELEESQINLVSEESKLKDLLKIVRIMGGQLSGSKSETHFPNDPENSFSLRFNDTISLDESNGKSKITWIKNESFPLNKTNKQTEIVIIVGEHVEKITMKFNYKHKNGPEPNIYHDTPQTNWWLVLSILNGTAETLINP